MNRHKCEVVGLLVREFCCSGTDVSAKVLAMYADTELRQWNPSGLPLELSQAGHKFLMMLANVFLLLTRSLASAHRIAEILGGNIVLTSPENGVKKVKDGSIDFENVSFKYREDAGSMH